MTAADQFWQLLPREDPCAAQGAVSEVLSELVARNDLSLGQFRALLALDQLARGLGDALLIDFAKGRAPTPSPETGAWQSAYALCRSFGQAFEHALRHILDDRASRGWCEHIPTILLRLFQHRQVEFLLRPYTNEHSIPDSWSGLHGAYRYAESADVRSQPLLSRRCHEERGEVSTLEREYIHVLLLQLLNDGRLSPFEAFWLSRRIPRWCAVLSLQSENAGPAADGTDRRFVVDLDGAAGLVRPSRSTAGTPRYLDPAPMLALIDDEIASFRDPARPVDRSSPFRPGRQLKLLRIVSTVLLPRPAPIDRRGKRLPIASTVEAIVGLSRITRVLRHEERKKSVPSPSAPADVEAIASIAGGERSTASSSDRPPTGAAGSAGTIDGFSGPGEVWQLKDRSESGCRLRGRIGNQNRVLPGALVAFRERDNIPWTLAVVRRLRKRIGDRVDIGVECLGRDPVVVALSADNDSAASSNGLPPRKRKHCIALYLREGSGHPNLPFGTLVLSPREFKAGRCLALRSGGAGRTVRLKEPIEEHDGFVWLPYEVVFRPATARQDPGSPDPGGPATGLPPSDLPVADRSVGAAGPVVPNAVARRRESQT